MQNVNSDMNATLISLIRKVLDSMSLEAENKGYTWISEVYSVVTWVSTSTRCFITPTHLPHFSLHLLAIVSQ